MMGSCRRSFFFTLIWLPLWGCSAETSSSGGNTHIRGDAAASNGAAGKSASHDGGGGSGGSRQKDTAAGGKSGGSIGGSSGGEVEADGSNTAGSGGGFIIDDSGVTFDWPETVPGQGKCQPGNYLGTFSCEYIPTALSSVSGNIPVTGTITITLQESSNGEFLEIKQGNLDGNALLIFLFKSSLAGKLTCSTNTFDASAVDGTYSDAFFGLIATGTFEGTLTGTYDRQTQVLSGTWAMKAAPPNEGNCDGPWSVTLQP